MNFNIDDVVVEEASVTLDFPEVTGATITIARISTEVLEEIRRKSTVGKQLNPETKTFDDKIDNKKFIKLYSDVVILDWTGLKAKHLTELILCKIPKDQMEEVVNCTPENKNALMSKSSAFDSFISSTLQTVSLFNQELEEEEVKKQKAG